MAETGQSPVLPRKSTRRISVGPVPVGGGAPITVQTMTKTDTRDVSATAAQVNEAAMFGADLVRLAIPDEDAAAALVEIRRQVNVPLIADIHFDHCLAVAALEAGVDGLRINPGNIGSRERVAEVVSAARERMVPIRIGVNSGSLEKDLREKYGGSPAAALVESAMRHVSLLEDLDYHEIKISVKASDVLRTIAACRELSQRTDYPLHLGVTEAGTFLAGTVRSSVGMGVLLAEGIGDTIRVSLTDTPAKEVQVGLELLRSLGLREPGASVTSCPTCGRCQVDVGDVASRVETALDAFYRENPSAPHPHVAVMGCMVNGPGEARDADIAVAGGKGKFALFIRGEHHAALLEGDVVEALLDAARQWSPAGR